MSDESKVPQGERDRQRANQIIRGVIDRLLRLAQNRPFRFRDTSRAEASMYLAGLFRFEGLLGGYINTLEKMNARFPLVFRAYLREMGREHAALFEGSEADPYQMREYKRRALDLLKRDGVKEQVLGRNHVVFMFHQGYTFLYFEGGDRERFDSPVYQYTEGEAAPKKVAEGFAELLDAELRLMEENNRLQRESGGHFVSLAGGFRRTVYPARGEDPSPLETEDQFTD
jgi:hypothetical protein